MTGVEDEASLPIALVHGWGSTSDRTWANSKLETDLIEYGRSVSRIDLLGHGRSEAPYDPACYQRLSFALLDALPPSEVIDAAGFSLGGKLLIQLAARFPRRFRRLVVLGVGDNIFRPENGELISRILLGASQEPVPAVLASTIEEARSSGNDLRALAAVICRPSTVPTPADLTSITADVLLITGSDDRIAEATDTLESVIPSCQTVSIESADHSELLASPAAQRTAAHFLVHGNV